MRIEDLVRIEDEIRKAKAQGSSSTVTFTMQISAMEYFLSLARKELGENNVIEFRVSANAKQYKPDTNKTKVYKSWQDPSVRQQYVEQRQKQKTARQRRREQQERTMKSWNIYSGNQKKATA